MSTDPTAGLTWRSLDVDGERYEWRCAVGVVEVREPGEVFGTSSSRLVVEVRKPALDTTLGAAYPPETLPTEALVADLIGRRGPRAFRNDDLRFGLERRDDGVYVVGVGRRRGSAFAHMATLAAAQRLVRLLGASERVPIADANAPGTSAPTRWAEAAPGALSVQPDHGGTFDVVLHDGELRAVIAAMKSAADASAVVACLSSAVRIRVVGS